MVLDLFLYHIFQNLLLKRGKLCILTLGLNLFTFEVVLPWSGSCFHACGSYRVSNFDLGVVPVKFAGFSSHGRRDYTCTFVTMLWLLLVEKPLSSNLIKLLSIALKCQLRSLRWKEPTSFGMLRLHDFLVKMTCSINHDLRQVYRIPHVVTLIHHDRNIQTNFGTRGPPLCH